ncbi:putative reverse transcriptase domain-containing protein [Tanacetum coccineum]
MKGNSGPKKFVLSLHKFLAVIFPDDDIKERTSRWNIKKEKRVMRHQEVHKLCDASLKRVLEGLKSYNNDVKHGYVTPSLGGFVFVFYPLNLIYSKSKEHEKNNREVQFLGHVVNNNGIHVDPSKTESGDKQEESFHILKEKLCNALVLAIPNGLDDFMVYCDASNQGFGCLLMLRVKVIAYASRQLKVH